MTFCLKRKNKKRFFSFQSMPNLNFAELMYVLKTFFDTIYKPEVFHISSSTENFKVFPFSFLSSQF